MTDVEKSEPVAEECADPFSSDGWQLYKGCWFYNFKSIHSTNGFWSYGVVNGFFSAFSVNCLLSLLACNCMLSILSTNCFMSVLSLVSCPE